MPSRYNAALTLFIALSTSVTIAEAAPPSSGTPSTVDVMTLRLMLQKGVITEAEYESALGDVADTSGSRAAESTSLVIGKWSASLYGFAEADYIFDSTGSYSDLAGSGQVAHPGTYAASHPQSIFSVRDSRFGFRFRAPEYHGIRASALIESDFMGDGAPPTNGVATEPGADFTKPALRLRRAFLKVETPVVDVLFGQDWHLFGWQSAYQPNTVQIQGVPGELYAQTPQLRLSKAFAGRGVTLDVAIAVVQSPSESAIPEGEAGLHFALNNWTGVQTLEATGTRVSPASIAVTGDLRRLSVANYPSGGTLAAPSLQSTTDVNLTGAGIAVDAFIPIIQGSAEYMGNSLSILGEFVYGQGIGDLYTDLTSGLGVPALVPVPAGSPAGTISTTSYNPQINPGLVTVTSNGDVTVIKWQTIRAGFQYTLPGLDGKMWISANYANVSSPNALSLLTTTPATLTTKAPTIRNALNWFDVNVMGDLTPAVRLGVEYAYSTDKYADGQSGINHRVQGSAFYMF